MQNSFPLTFKVQTYYVASILLICFIVSGIITYFENKNILHIDIWISSLSSLSFLKQYSMVVETHLYQS